MKKSTIWIILVSVITIALLLISCGPEKTSTAPGTTTSKTTTPPTSTTVSSDKPQYGGTFVAAQAADTAAFDCSTQFDLLGWQISIGNEALLVVDWAKGPAGTGETDMTASHLGQTSLFGGWLAESWELTDSETLIFHLRENAKWWNKAPANGRLFTADDVVWNLKTQWENPGGNFANFFPAPIEKPVSITALDDHTVEIKCNPGKQGIQILESGARAHMMLPELYPTQKQWENALGTGAFMLTDYVSAVSMTFTRNPDYYGVNPVGPGKGDQLPYIETLRFPIIPDTSTQQAAFRTGKIDVLQNLAPEEFNEIKDNTRWTFESKQGYGFFNQPTGREDKPNLPFQNIKVRQAMNLAVDKVAIARDYYEGQADLMGYPYNSSKPLEPYYTPLEELPEFCQELIRGGNIEKAKQLLTEAGYPEGFKTVIGCTANDVDILSIVKEDLSKVGIEMDIKQYETGIYWAVDRERSWDEMWFKNAKQSFMPYYMFEMRSESNDSAAFWDSPETQKVYEDIQKYLGIDDKIWSDELKAVTPLVIESSFSIWMPQPYRYQVWQPWLKNYFGAVTQGNFVPFHHTYFNWIDTDLKKEILGQ
jgi:peptide/nickel transport system substrate-binding protein